MSGSTRAAMSAGARPPECPPECPREPELLAALGRGFVPVELEAHARECASCAELQLVAGALLEDRAAAVAAAPVPTSGSMWWRMRTRHRRDAQALARRTLLAGQAASIAVALGLLALFFGGALVQIAQGVVTAVRLHTPLLFAMVALLLLAPIGGWVALRGK
jgi:hypothetical protein